MKERQPQEAWMFRIELRLAARPSGSRALRVFAVTSSLALVSLVLLHTPAVADVYKDCASYTHKQAVRACTEIIEHSAEQPKRQVERAYINRGKRYHSQRKLKNAIADFSAAIALNPKSAAAHFGRARAHINNGSRDRSIADLEKALALKPDHETAFGSHYLLGRIYSRAGQYDRAIGQFTTAMKLNNGVGALNDRGSAYLKSGDYTRAIADFDTAIAKNPKNQAARINRKKAAEALRSAGKAVPPPPQSEEEIEKQLASRLNDDPGKLKTRIAQCASREFIYSDKIIGPDTSRGFGGMNSTKGLNVCTDVITSSISTVGEKAAAYANRSRANAFLNRHATALEDLNEAIALQPNFAEAFRLRGAARQYLEVKEVQRVWNEKDRKWEAPPPTARRANEKSRAAAMEDFDTAIRLDDKNSKAFHDRGRLFVRLKQYERAMQDFNAAIALKYSRGYLERGHLHNRLKKYESAIKDFGIYLEDPEWAYTTQAKEGLKRAQNALSPKPEKKADDAAGTDSAKRKKAWEELDKQRAGKAPKLRRPRKRKTIRQTAKVEPPAPAKPEPAPKPNTAQAVKRMLDDCKSNDLERLIAGCAGALKSGRIGKQATAVAHYRRGEAYRLKGEFDRAIEDFSQVLTLAPNDVTTRIQRGNAYLGKRQYQEAVDDFSRAIKIDPKSGTAYYNRGRVFAMAQRYDQAIRDFDQALKLNPKDAQAYNNRGNAYKNIGELDRAIRDYKEAIRLDPKQAEAYGNLGRAYQIGGAYAQAVEAFSAFVQLKPRSAGGHNNLGNALSAMGELERAIENFDTALRLDPDRYAAYFYNNRGSAYHKLGEYEQAISDFDEALSRKQDYTQAQENKKKSLAALAGQ